MQRRPAPRRHSRLRLGQRRDPEGAKRYLTAARDTLGQLTQLSGAAKVEGDARTQITALITNFNELISTNENWRSSYDKVNANVVALLGPETPEPAQPPAAGAPVAVGTSGTAAATLDPAVRAKLVEFRNHLTQFEKAAGADTPSASVRVSPRGRPSSQRLHQPAAPRLSRARRRRSPRKSWAKAVRSCTSTPSKRS